MHLRTAHAGRLLIALWTPLISWEAYYQLHATDPEQPVRLSLFGRITNESRADLTHATALITTMPLRPRLRLPRLEPIYLDQPVVKAGRLAGARMALAKVELPAVMEAFPESTPADRILTMAWHVAALQVPAQESATIPLDHWHLQAQWKWLLFPEVSPWAHVVLHWAAPTLLPAGNADIFLQGQLKGSQWIRPGPDTIALVLGQDRRIYAERKILKFQNGRIALRQRAYAYRQYLIIVHSDYDTPLVATVQARVPVSRHEAIKVHWQAEPAPTRVDSTTGRLTWEIPVSPDAPTRLVYEYDVRYPADWKLHIP